jgi:hypothetical protein
MNTKNCILEVSAVAGIIGSVLITFGLLLGVQVSAQQQTMQAENHHPNSSSNQSSSVSSTAEQQHQNTTTTVGGGMMSINQTFTTRWMSLVDGVKVSGISIIDNEHIAINLRYDGEGEPPGVSVVAMTSNSSSDRMIGSIMQNSTTSGNNNSSMRIMQSGSNYLEAGWQVQHPNSATVLVQLDGDIPEGGYIMVIVVPFLHR